MGMQTTFVQRATSQRSSSQYVMSSRSGAAKNPSLLRGASTDRVINTPARPSSISVVTPSRRWDKSAAERGVMRHRVDITVCWVMSNRSEN
jgi:hypothetical protein